MAAALLALGELSLQLLFEGAVADLHELLVSRVKVSVDGHELVERSFSGLVRVGALDRLDELEGFLVNQLQLCHGLDSDRRFANHLVRNLAVLEHYLLAKAETHLKSVRGQVGLIHHQRAGECCRRPVRLKLGLDRILWIRVNLSLLISL